MKQTKKISMHFRLWRTRGEVERWNIDDFLNHLENSQQEDKFQCRAERAERIDEHFFNQGAGFLRRAVHKRRVPAFAKKNITAIIEGNRHFGLRGVDYFLRDKP